MTQSETPKDIFLSSIKTFHLLVVHPLIHRHHHQSLRVLYQLEPASHKKKTFSRATITISSHPIWDVEKDNNGMKATGVIRTTELTR